MDVYKLKTRDARGKPISKDRFEEETRCRYPWYQPSSDGKTSQFAVCPGCDNPIQLIGLYKLPANTPRPFGKHTTQSIRGLTELDPEERDNCAYFKPRQHNKSDRRSRFDGIPRKIVTLLIEQFDRVVYLLEKQIGVRFSRATLQKMLRQYRGEQGFMYTGAMLRNVPWIFAYMSDSTDLYGQAIRNDAIISALLENVPEAYIDPQTHRLLARPTSPGQKRRYFSAALCFIRHHPRKSEQGSLLETMRLSVSVRWDQEIDPTVIHEEIITFDYDFFERLTHTPDQSHRRFELVELAREELGDLIS
ncbi:hypothetical protein ACRYJU_04715 [Alloalcanivorax xenomutans]|uniref:Restriction endonuclease n=1 Tax=Alcanivorax xiamenensis TaxID=1177156 RepID=A0ABQ6Y568_9GAMM|nr:hypothetical protein [Alcanivorax xiamenensis]KAF0804371.1 hypothetical protein A6D6_03108 [Alcanivorax xiamenensis]